ncbi:MAG TPA: T9SS type A sorting domain-containing protein [Bacteroidia bacterium]|nr:T9SS type A sorting domain-containing protein [Bacteroidales bacterium]HRS59862.1 T9SS type A sorting domain-containing protein [Bacteroidia bacterium]
MKKKLFYLSFLLCVLSYQSNAQTWTFVGQIGFTPGPAYGSKILVKDDTPYVAFYGTTYSDPGKYRIQVMFYDGTAWQQYGPNVTNDTTFNHWLLDFKKSAAGELFIAYIDKFAGNKVSVKKFDGNNWVYVGNQGFSPNSTENQFLEMYNDTPYVAIMEYITNFQKDIIVMKYDGTNWVTVGTNKVATWANLDGFKIVNGVPFVSYTNNSHKGLVSYFNGTNWIVINNGPLYYPMNNSYCFQMDYFGDTLYIPYMVNYLSSSQGNPFFLIRYNVVTQSIDTIHLNKGNINIDNNFERLKLNNQGEIFFVKYQGPSSNGKREIIRLDRDNNNTLTIYGGSFPVYRSMENLDLAFNDNNKPYVVFKDESAYHRLTVCTLGNSSSVGSIYNKSNIYFLYPNPNNGTFFIQSEKPAIFELTDITGKLINTYRTQGTALQVNENLPAGLYFICEKESGITQKIIIQ